MVFDGTFNVPAAPSVMVCGVAKAVELKLMLPVLSAAAKASASRRLHEASVPVPAVACGVQLEALPASSSAVVTTSLVSTELTVS
jgi:hypothetical protein